MELQFVEQEFDGILLWVPLVCGRPWKDFSGKNIDDYPPFCGAGSGIGDLIVPETMYFLRMSVACEIHDISWQLAPPTETARKVSNERFLVNMLRVIEARSDWITRFFRNDRAMFYYNMVDTEKNYLFWKLKVEQGYWIPEDKMQLVEKNGILS